MNVDEIYPSTRVSSGTADMNQTEYIHILEDALDHIMRVAGMASKPTRRLDWISARAKLALKGDPYNADKLPQFPRCRDRERREWAERVLSEPLEGDG